MRGTRTKLLQLLVTDELRDDDDPKNRRRAATGDRRGKIPFSFKHLNRAIRSQERVMLSGAAIGGRETETTETSSLSSRKLPGGARLKLMRSRGKHAPERVHEDAAGKEKTNTDTSERNPNNDDAVRAPTAVKAIPLPDKVHAGDQDPGPSSSSSHPPSSPGKRPVRSRSNHHGRSAPETAGIDDDDEKRDYQRGLQKFMSMSPDAQNSEVDRHFGIEAQPRSQRVAAMQRREVDLPFLDFRLPIDRAMADVEKVLGPQTKRRRN
jgi:hypothetical protein